MVVDALEYILNGGFNCRTIYLGSAGSYSGSVKINIGLLHLPGACEECHRAGMGDPALCKWYVAVCVCRYRVEIYFLDM